MGGRVVSAMEGGAQGGSPGDLQRVNEILRAARSIYQLVLEEKDPETLLGQACSVLADVCGYRCAWAGLFDRDNRLRPSAGTGLDGGLEALHQQIEAGEWPGTCMKSVGESGAGTVPDVAAGCQGCVLQRSCGVAVLVGALRYHGRDYGLLVVSAPAGVTESSEELSLFGEVAGVLGFALHNMHTARERGRANERLRESEEHFRAVVQNSVDAIFVETNGLFSYANPATVALFGARDEQELLGKHILDYIRPQDRAAVAEQMRKLREERSTTLPNERGLIRPDGSEVEVEFLGVPFMHNGRPSALVFGRDLTERKRNERAMADALGTTRAIVENAPIGVLIYKATGRCVSANEAAARMLGTTQAELTLLNFFEIESWKRSGLLKAAHEALSTGRTTTTVDEITSTFGVHLWMKSVFTPFELGGELHLMLMFDDITEAKVSEQALRESEEGFRTLVDEAPDGIFLQREGRFQYVNPAMARILGAGRSEELLGKEALDVVSPEYRDQLTERRRWMREGGRPLPPFELAFRRFDGTEVPVEAHAVPFSRLGEDVFLIFVRDIGERAKAQAERAQLQDQLVQAQRMESVGQLAGGVAHDFNNILMVQKGYCEMLRQGLKKDDPLAKGLAQIEAYADRAAVLTRQLLAFSRKQTLQPDVLDLNFLVGDLEDMLRRLLGENVELETVPSPHPSLIRADRSQIEQVFVNLGVNARDAMPRGGKFTVELAWVEADEEHSQRQPGLAPGSYVQLTLTDTGEGMDAETQKRIFEPFFTTRGDVTGTGLGLSTVYGIVRQSGGFIAVESELGKGTSFKIWLPRVEDELRLAVDRRVSAITAQGELVLVVEDEPSLRGLVVMMLENLGYRVEDTENAAEALRLIEEASLTPDLLVTDIVMPGMSGITLVERLRKKLTGLKVIYMSGYADETILHHGVMEPGVDFLRKPFNLSDLEARIEKLLGHPAPDTESSGEPPWRWSSGSGA